MYGALQDVACTCSNYVRVRTFRIEGYVWQSFRVRLGPGRTLPVPSLVVRDMFGYPLGHTLAWDDHFSTVLDLSYACNMTWYSEWLHALNVQTSLHAENTLSNFTFANLSNSPVFQTFKRSVFLIHFQASNIQTFSKFEDTFPLNHSARGGTGVGDGGNGVTPITMYNHMNMMSYQCHMTWYMTMMMLL